MRACKSCQALALVIQQGRRAQICGAKSPGDPNDEEDPPVTCTALNGHKGDHEGGTRCGTITWKNVK